MRCERILDGARRHRAKELLVLTGEAPDHHPGVRERLRALGFEDFTGYAAWACEQALERGLLPHTNLGVLSREDLARLREVTASQGLMLESVNPDLVAHQGSPTKHPEQRLATIRAAGELKIPFTSGILVGIGESEADRMAVAGGARRVRPRPGGHPPELRPAPPLLRRGAGRDRHRGRRGLLAHRDRQRRREHESPAWAREVTIADMKRLVAEARRLMPEVGIQIPPNLADWWPELVRAGATDLGGLSANGDHISPEHPFPSPRAGAHAARRRRLRALRAPVRLPAVHRRDLAGAARARRHPRPASVVRAAPPRRRARTRHDRARPRRRTRSPPEELTALFSDVRPEVVEDMRQAADALRAELAGELVTFVVNRNINVSNVCTVGCSFCGFGVSKRSPDAYEHDRDDFVRRVHEAVDYGATEICMQSGIHPDWQLEDYLGWLRLAKETAPQIHMHAYSPMEIAHMCDISELSPAEVFARLRDAGLDSTPGTAAEVLHDGVRERISPNKLPVSRWVEIIEASHRAGLRSTVTVMFGHIEQPAELAEHMRVVRALQERTGGFTEFVPLSFIPFQTLLGRTQGVQEISREDNLRHTAAFRLALGRSIPSLQASWVKMGLDAATEALRWGVNDLGGTLMEESISRMAGSQHGVRLDPGGPRRRRAPRRAPRRRAHDALRRSAAATTLARLAA